MTIHVISSSVHLVRERPDQSESESNTADGGWFWGELLEVRLDQDQDVTPLELLAWV